MSERKVITKSDWISSFQLIGKAKVTDGTYKIDEKSSKSSWIYNLMSLGIDCGEKYGTVFCEMMGGYSEDHNNIIYAHGKKDDDTDDFESQIQVDWDDRFDEDILSTIGNMSFIRVGIELTDKGKIFYKNFLSQYDAISYIHDNLENGMVVSVRGNLKYSIYQDEVRVRKNVNSIVLSKAEEEDFTANFTQTILLNKDSTDLKTVNKENGLMYVDAIVLDYLKELNGVEIKGQYPYHKQFEYIFPDITNGDQCKLFMDKMFNVKKDVTQITFLGNFVEGGAVVKPTFDELPDDVKELVTSGIYTEEEAIEACQKNAKFEQHMILSKPFVRKVGNDKLPVVQKFEERYTEDDLILDYIAEEIEDDINVGMNEPEDDNVENLGSANDLNWLNQL